MLFTPHLAPMNRGILATCYARPAARRRPPRRCSPRSPTRYRDEPFVVVRRRLAVDQGDARHATAAHLTARFDERTGTVIAICAIDNLAKGASGGAVQAANVALGLAETAGLSAGRARTRERGRDRATPAQADVLVEALPYIRRFAEQVVVVKYGGNALAGASDARRPRAVRRGHRADAPGRACARSSCTAAARRSAT